MIRALWFCCVLFAVAQAYAYPSLKAAYAAAGFEPAFPGNAVVVFFSDQHMCLRPQGLPAEVVTTNLDWRLVSTVNSMSPVPAKIIVSGDVSSTLSPVPGIDGLFYPEATALAMAEMACFRAEVLRFTKIDQTNIVWIPGNHDQSPKETNAETFSRMFPFMPTYQSFDLAGLRFFLLNSGNYGEPSDSERQWLQAQVAATSPTQAVVVVAHQPPFHGRVAHRGVGRLLRDLFRDWETRWWVLDGHEHGAGLEVFNVGRSNVAQMTIGPASTNTFMGFTYDVGCMFVCLSNGISSMIYYHYLDQSFSVVRQPDWDNPERYVAPFEETPGLLWRRLKTPLNAPELVVSNALNSMDWWAYPVELQWRLPLDQHQNQATDFLLLVTGMSPDSILDFGVDRTNWMTVPLPAPANNVFSFSIPDTMRGLPAIYARFRSFGGNNWVAGWGLSSTNPGPLITYPRLTSVPAQFASAGRVFGLTNTVEDPYSPPDRLRFTLLEGPATAAIDADSGILTWRPGLSDIGQTVDLAVKVADDGTPAMSATNRFTITVTPCDSQPLPPPSEVFASDGSYCGFVVLRWNAVTDAEIYQVYQDDVLVGVTSETNYIAHPGDTVPHAYAVRASNACGTSELSAADSGQSAVVRILAGGLPAGGGSVLGGGDIVCGTEIVLKASADAAAGYEFINWSEGQQVVSEAADYSFAATVDRGLVANFAKAPLRVEVTMSSPGLGTVSGAGRFVEGQTAVLVAAPIDQCSTFLIWKEDGVPVSSDPVIAFTVERSRTFVAEFAPVYYSVETLSSPACAGGSIQPGAQTCGSTVTVSAVPNPGYSFLSWTENGVPVSFSAEYAFPARSNRALVAQFEGSLPTSAEFSSPDLVSTNLTILAADGFQPDLSASGCWLLSAPGGSFTAGFDACPGGDYDLTIRHRTLGSAECAGLGYSPVTILLNGAQLAWNFDPAEHHQGSHELVTDSWRITASEGPNELRFTAGQLCSAYGIAGIEIRPAHPNDLFADRLEIRGGTASAQARNVAASKEPSEPWHAGQKGGHSVWWRWTAPDTGLATVSTAGSTFDTLLGVYTGDAVDSLAFVASNDDATDDTFASQASFDAVAGVSYSIAVDGYNGAVGDIRLSLNLPPSNDSFARRRTLTGYEDSVTGFSDNASLEPFEPLHTGDPGGYSVWWSWTPPISGVATFSTAGSTFDTTLALYTGTVLSNLTQVASNDDQDTLLGRLTSLITRDVVAGTEYQIAVDGAGGDHGNIALRVSVATDSPYLMTRVVGDELVISWPERWTGYVLETRASPEEPWTYLANSSPVTNTITGTARFFRLSK